MQFLKVSCTQCLQYHECPQKTKMFINYCGSNSKQVEDGIREAVFDCRARQGQLFKRNSIVENSASSLPQLAVLISH